MHLPPSYLHEPGRRYPVLYVQDGQNAFSSAGPGVAYGWGNWELDIAADQLCRENRMREVILVTVDCTSSRYREYRGPVAANQENQKYEAYRDFLIHELKPGIDKEYRTLADPANSALIGSSMGGICSVAIAWERPDVFGQAASLSGAFQVENKYFLRHVLRRYSGPVKPLRIYLDSGDCDYSGGDDGLNETMAVAAEFKRIGWNENNLHHFIDPRLTAEQLTPFHLPEDKFREAQASQHNELYWRLRAWRPLCWMFPKV